MKYFILLIILLIFLSSCGGDTGFVSNPVMPTVTPVILTPTPGGPTSTPGGPTPTSIPIGSSEYVVFAWNDLGMHCLNPTYDKAVILPPYNNVWVQVVRRDAKPQIITNGLTVEYKMVDNTYSYGKTSSGANYGQFWDNVQKLFGVNLEKNTGLNLEDPSVHNSLSGNMLSKGDHFQADGIPVVPVNDSGMWNPYQIIDVSVKDGSGKIVAHTRTTVPTSDEINCAKCHLTIGSYNDTFENILELHDKENSTSLLQEQPVLCAKCHGSPALGISGPGSSGKYLSQAIHSKHGEINDQGLKPGCSDCHPGEITRCSRSTAHKGTGTDGNCITCHGDLAQVGNSIPGRIPWLNEPQCLSCHANIAQVDTGGNLYRKSKGHGNLYCTSCHGSPHAMTPTDIPSQFLYNGTNPDHYQSLQYQNKAVTISSCRACHEKSHGGGDTGEFAEEHGGSNPEKKSACNICHTSVTADTAKWPHSFQWKNR